MQPFLRKSIQIDEDCFQTFRRPASSSAGSHNTGGDTSSGRFLCSIVLVCYVHWLSVCVCVCVLVCACRNVGGAFSCQLFCDCSGFLFACLFVSENSPTFIVSSKPCKAGETRPSTSPRTFFQSDGKFSLLQSSLLTCFFRLNYTPSVSLSLSTNVESFFSSLQHSAFFFPRLFPVHAKSLQL